VAAPAAAPAVAASVAGVMALPVLLLSRSGAGAPALDAWALARAAVRRQAGH